MFGSFAIKMTSEGKYLFQSLTRLLERNKNHRAAKKKTRRSVCHSESDSVIWICGKGNKSLASCVIPHFLLRLRWTLK